jgi:hypothetical protein
MDGRILDNADFFAKRNYNSYIALRKKYKGQYRSPEYKTKLQIIVLRDDEAYAKDQIKRKERQLAGIEKRKETLRKKKEEEQKKRLRGIGLSIDDLERYVKKSIGNKEKPFRIRIHSGVVAGVSALFNFRSFQHFQNWLEAIDRQGTISESENYKTVAEITDYKDVFNIISKVDFLPISGACNTNVNEYLKKSNEFYDFEVFSPKGGHNNCGFRIIEKITGLKLNYSELRAKYNLEKDDGLTTDMMYDIYMKSGSAQKYLVFIDETFNGEYNKNYEYVYVSNNHYYYVEKMKYKDYSDVKTKRGFVFWDIETRPISENDYVMVGDNKSRILSDAILCAWYAPYKGEYKKLYFDTDDNKTSCRKFLDWLTMESSEGRFYHCIAHNGSRFDVYFLLANMTEQEKLMTDTQLRGYSVIGMQYKSHLFKDSCCFLTNSLETLCDNFKVKEGKLVEFMYNGNKMSNKNICFYKPELSLKEFMKLKESEPEFWSMYTEYCVYDCIGLKNVWISFRSQLQTLTDEMFKYKPELKAKVELMGTNTIGSLAKKMLENSCLEKGKDGKYYSTKAHKKFMQFVSSKDDKGRFKLDDEKIKFINNFKRGGISHSNQPGKHTHSLISFDITSQYPACMIHMLIPCGESFTVEKYSPFYNGYYHLKNLVFDCKYKFKPVSNKNENNVLEWNVDEIKECYLDSFMIKYLKENYGLVDFEVVTGLVSQSYMRGEELFGDYVNILFAEKRKQDEFKETKNELYNPALRECIKLFLNSLSGKLVEDPSRYFSLSYKLNSEKEQKLMNGLNATIEKDECKYNPWVGAGVMVYSYSKRLLFEYVKCLPENSNDVIHIETDSIYFNKKHAETFVKNVEGYVNKKYDYYPIAIGDELGNVKVEKDNEDIPDRVSYFLGKKFYAIKCRDKKKNCIEMVYKIKGIPLKTIDEYGNDVALVDMKLYDDVYNWKVGDDPIVKEFYTMKKDLFSQKCYISSHKMSRTITPNMKFALYE